MFSSPFGIKGNERARLLMSLDALRFLATLHSIGCHVEVLNAPQILV
ncbi:hypothetical protein [Leptolyngbya sp. FACHB-261]|nr:hypothetical protein [Leptolyngbya sp. FACHB-261]